MLVFPVFSKKHHLDTQNDIEISIRLPNIRLQFCCWITKVLMLPNVRQCFFCLFDSSVKLERKKTVAIVCIYSLWFASSFHRMSTLYQRWTTYVNIYHKHKYLALWIQTFESTDVTGWIRNSNYKKKKQHNINICVKQ